jgi:N-acetylmuramic acid 6-phosphate (MurNAc-6-P) etherase
VDTLAQADGDVKIAALMVFGVDRAFAQEILARNDDNLRLALADIARGPRPSDGANHG